MAVIIITANVINAAMLVLDCQPCNSHMPRKKSRVGDSLCIQSMGDWVIAPASWDQMHFSLYSRRTRPWYGSLHQALLPVFNRPFTMPTLLAAISIHRRTPRSTTAVDFGLAAMSQPLKCSGARRDARRAPICLPATSGPCRLFRNSASHCSSDAGKFLVLGKRACELSRKKSPRRRHRACAAEDDNLNAGTLRKMRSAAASAPNRPKNTVNGRA